MRHLRRQQSPTESGSPAPPVFFEGFHRQVGLSPFSFCVPPSYILGVQSVGPPVTCSSTPPKLFLDPTFVWCFQKMGSLAHNGRFVSHVPRGLGRAQPTNQRRGRLESTFFFFRPTATGSPAPPGATFRKRKKKKKREKNKIMCRGRLERSELIFGAGCGRKPIVCAVDFLVTIDFYST